MEPDNLIKLIDYLITDAYSRKSKCTSEILKVDGMCGLTTRHLYNNICSIFTEGVLDQQNKEKEYSYLEIGCWKGASTIASLYKNNLNATVIDNWTEFGGCKFDFVKNISKYLDENSVKKIQIINQDCFRLKEKTVLNYSPYSFFLYDGPHSVQEHCKSIVDFWKYLDDICIIIIDDWNWDAVRNGTYKGFDLVNAKILHKWELYEPMEQNKLGLWNGCCIFVIHK